MVFRKDQLTIDEPFDFEGQPAVNISGINLNPRNLSLSPPAVGEICKALSGEIVYKFSSSDTLTIINSDGKIPSSLIDINLVMELGAISDINDVNVANNLDDDFLIRKNNAWINKPFVKRFTFTDFASASLPINHQLGYPPKVIVTKNGIKIHPVIVYTNDDNEISIEFSKPPNATIKVYLR